MSNLSIVDPLQWVRSRPQQFFQRQKPEAVDLLNYIMADVIELGGGNCIIRRVADWYVIGSNKAWLVHDKYSMKDLFNHVVPEPRHGLHSMRGEILVGAYAEEVAVLNDGVVSLIKGECSTITADASVGMRQALVFRTGQ